MPASEAVSPWQGCVTFLPLLHLLIVPLLPYLKFARNCYW